jgi:hypothetical protein
MHVEHAKNRMLYLLREENGVPRPNIDFVARVQLPQRQDGHTDVQKGFHLQPVEERAVQAVKQAGGAHPQSLLPPSPLPPPLPPPPPTTITTTTITTTTTTITTITLPVAFADG